MKTWTPADLRAEVGRQKSIHALELDSATAIEDRGLQFRHGRKLDFWKALDASLTARADVAYAFAAVQTHMRLHLEHAKGCPVVGVVCEPCSQLAADVATAFEALRRAVGIESA